MLLFVLMQNDQSEASFRIGKEEKVKSRHKKFRVIEQTLNGQRKLGDYIASHQRKVFCANLKGSI